ncbi:MAG: hypothetical protein JO142_02740 [Burkholderiales bacterium]|nr:hypothetical protein [Burkholderiales bacterium]
MVLLILFTSHCYQKGDLLAPEDTYRAIEEHFEQIVSGRGVRTVGEELNEGALRSNQTDPTSDTLSRSILKSVADRLGIPHRFCEPEPVAGMPWDDPDDNR